MKQFSFSFLPIRKFKIQENSMMPLFHPGDIVLVSFIPYLISKPQKGDVIVFQNNGKVLIKKIKKIHEDEVFVVGENKTESIDSRQFGWIEKKQIIGKVLKKLS